MKAVTFAERRGLSKWVKVGIPAMGMVVFWLFYHYVPLVFSSLMISLAMYYILCPFVDALELRSINRSAASLALVVGMVWILWVLMSRLLAFSADIQNVHVVKFQENLVTSLKESLLWTSDKVPLLKSFAQEVPQSSGEKSRNSSSISKKRNTKVPAIEEEERSGTPLHQPRFLSSQWIDEKIRLWVETYAPGIARKLAALVPNLILVPYFTFFFLRDGRRGRKIFIQWLPNPYFEPALKFFYEIDRRMKSYLQGLLLDCVLVGLLVGFGAWVVGAPYPVVLGILAGVFNSVPLLGPLLNAVITLLITLGAGKPSETLWGIGAVLVLSRICDDLIFCPTIFGKSHHLHPVVVVCAILIGEAMAGAWGMFLAIPTVSVLSLGMNILRELSVEEDPIRIPPSAYAPFA